MTKLAKEVEAQRRKSASKRLFDVLELARRLDIFAEVAEELYDRAGGELATALTLATEEPPLTSVGRKSEKGKSGQP